MKRIVYLLGLVVLLQSLGTTEAYARKEKKKIKRRWFMS